jgi:hypothetical protein
MCGGGIYHSRSKHICLQAGEELSFLLLMKRYDSTYTQIEIAGSRGEIRLFNPLKGSFGEKATVHFTFKPIFT